MTAQNLQVDDSTGALSLAAPAGVITEIATYAATYAAGKLVNLTAGPTATLADATTTPALKADAYIIDAGAGPGKVGFNGVIPGILVAAVPGTEYYLGAAGLAITPAAGGLIQSVGYAVNATDLLFIPGIPPL